MNNMKRLTLLVMLSFGLLFTGCIDIVEEVFINKDGSGKYLVTMDMSSLMGPEMKGMMQEMMQQEGEDDPSMENIELDSMIYFKDINPEMLEELERPDVFKSAFMHMQMSDSKEMMVIEFGLDFKDISDIDYFNKNLDKLGEGNPMGGGIDGGLLPKVDKLFSLNGKTLTRHPTPEGSEMFSDEEMEFASMMFATATYKTVYHFPGKVKKTSIPGAKIQGNELVVEESMINIIKGEAKLDGTVKFKN